MPFLVIRGTFHLTGLNVNGNPTGFQPDGDSIQFRPHVAALLDQLEQPGNPYRPTRIGSVNLRFEGIDAPELHYQGTRQPSPLAENARDFLTGQIGMNPVTYGPSGTTVRRPRTTDRRATSCRVPSSSMDGQFPSSFSAPIRRSPMVSRCSSTRNCSGSL